MHKYLLKDKRNLIGYMLVAPISAACEVGLAYAMAAALDYAMAGALGQFGKYAVIYILYILLSSAADRWTARQFYKVIANSIAALKNDIHKHIISMQYPEFQKASTAEYLTLLTTKTETLRNSYYTPLLHMYLQVLEFAAAFIGMIFLNPILGMYVIVLSFAQMGLPLLLVPMIERNGKNDAVNSTRYTSALKEMLSSFMTMKLFHIEKNLEKRQREFNASAEQAKCVSKCTNRLSYELSQGIANLMFLGIYLLGAVLVLKGAMTVPGVVAASQLMVYIATPLTQISETFAEIKSAKAVSGEIQKLFEIPADDDGVVNKSELSGQLTVKDLSFSYSGRQILQNVNFTFEKGKKYLILGESGSGKSTLLHLIGNLYRDYTGEILLDDCDIRTIQKNDYAHLVVYLPQEPFIYNDTLEANVRLYENADDEEVMKAIEQSGLLPYVEKSEQGIFTKVGEEAGKMSGGEKQRLSIARALLRKGEILLLDECTSHLDAETSRHIEETVFGLENRMVLYVAHNATEYAYEAADEVLYVRNGVIEKLTNEERRH